jgi:hypothetical protein
MLMPTFYPRAQAAIDRGSHNPFDLVGLTPQFLSEADPADAVTQLHNHYGHGGGWHDFNGFTLIEVDGLPQLTYPSDPPTEAIAYWQLRDEKIILFDHAWMAVVQPDQTFRVARMD